MANCSACRAEVVPGTRWCGICHTNIVNPAVGKLAAPRRRLGAYVLDLLIPIVTLGVLVLVGVFGAATGPDAAAGAAASSVQVLQVLFLAYLVTALVLFSRGTTPGKKLLGLRVINEDGTPARFMTMLLREWVGKLLSGMVVGVGFLWILFDKDNQGWHDKLMSTYVTG